MVPQKLDGENKVIQNDPDAIIIRTSWVYSSFGNNFVKTMIRLMKEKESINVVNDQTGSPTYAADLAAAILQIIAAAKWVPGIFNYSNEGQTTWYGFAMAIKALTHSSSIVHPVSTGQFPTAARRPRYSLLNKNRIRNEYSVSIPQWNDSLAICIQQITGQ